MRQDTNRPTILVTAGPTREKIDPVRFISNYSTGTFGYEIAREAKRRACRVVLVSGPVSLKAPAGVKLVKVQTAREMQAAVKKNFKRSDCLIMASAVCDWRAAKTSANKIKRGKGKALLKLEENPDILGELGRKKGRRILAGFALETEDLKKNAVNKLKNKNLDMIIANRLSKDNDVFGKNPLEVLILDKRGGCSAYRKRSKRELARIIIDRVLKPVIMR